MDTLEMAKEAQKQLRSTTRNWEPCLFKVDDLLSGIIQKLENIAQPVETPQKPA